MHDTRYLADVATILPNGAEGYAPQRGVGFRVARSWYDGAIMGAGAVHTTVEDFNRWLNNYDSATVGGRDIIRTMTTPTLLNDGSPATSGATSAYAIGLNVGTLRGLRVISHGGSWAGYRGHFLRFPDEHFAVATFCNLTTSGPDSLARKVAGIYLGDRMQPDSAALWSASLASHSHRAARARHARPAHRRLAQRRARRGPAHEACRGHAGSRSIPIARRSSRSPAIDSA